MDDAGADASPPGARPPRRAQTTLFALVLVVLVLGTAAGVVLARDRARDEVDERAQRVAGSVAAVLEVELDQVAARLAGAGAVVAPDGELELDTFAAFATDRTGTEQPGGMVLLAVVPAAERDAFEAELGRPITVVTARGRVPAPEAAVHHVAVAVAGDEATEEAIGIDFGADPARRRAIEQAGADGRPALSAPLTLTISEQRGVAMVRPVDGPDGVVRGFVSIGITDSALGQLVEGVAEAGADVVLLDGDQVLVAEEDVDELGDLDDLDERHVAPVDVPDRRWVVAVLPTGQADLTVMWLVAIAGVVAAVTVAALLVLTERHHRRLARANALLARGQARTRATQEVSGRLARALTGSEVASALVDHLPAAVDARTAVVALLERGGRLELLRPGGEPRRLPDPHVGTVVEQVLSTRQPAWLQSPLGWRGDAVAAELAGEAQALALLPLRTDDVVGILAVGYPRVHIFGDDEQALLQTASVLAGRALARGRRYDAEHQTAVAFQRAALPDALPVVPGLSIAARYRPAVHGATVGGDWYDALRLVDGRTLLVVGDVVGHGMTAAAAMGRLRTAFQTIVPYTGDPGSMLRGISQHVESIPDAFCTTVVCAVIDVDGTSLAWSRAGHPPPLVVRPGAGTTLLDAPCLPPLGVTPEVPAPVHRHALFAGDVVVLYTDGLVERRDESLDQGFERLAIVAEQLADLEVDELADALVEAMVPEEDQADDLAVLVVRVEPGPGSGPG